MVATCSNHFAGSSSPMIGPRLKTYANDDAHAQNTDVICVAGIAPLAEPSGALYWPDEGALIFADLHLEKGSAFAARGTLLPPYDTAATLHRLAHAIARHAPRLVIALGDSFHDGH